MSSPAIRLRNSLPDILREIRHGRVRAACRDDLLVFLPTALRAAAGRAEVVLEARRLQSEQIRVAILRAADEALTPAVRGSVSRRQWAGVVWNWMRLRCKSVGLERRPCPRVIRATLKKWTPPNGESFGLVHTMRAGNQNGE
jgi:hypothetical protein